jgi:hypothetical protein
MDLEDAFLSKASTKIIPLLLCHALNDVLLALLRQFVRVAKKAILSTTTEPAS